MNLVNVLSSNKCKLVFVLSFAIGYMILPQSVFSHHPLLAWPFVFIFSLSSACTVRAISESAKANRGKGLVSIVSSIFGFAALSVCSASFACGAAGIGLLSVFVQGLAISNFIHEFSQYIIAGSIIVQLYSLNQMGCFRKCKLANLLIRKK